MTMGIFFRKNIVSINCPSNGHSLFFSWTFADLEPEKNKSLTGKSPTTPEKNTSCLETSTTTIMPSWSEQQGTGAAFPMRLTFVAVRWSIRATFGIARQVIVISLAGELIGGCSLIANYFAGPEVGSKTRATNVV